MSRASQFIFVNTVVEPLKPKNLRIVGGKIQFRLGFFFFLIFFTNRTTEPDRYVWIKLEHTKPIYLLNQFDKYMVQKSIQHLN